MTPRVSVLMPVWNEAEHVEASVRSGLAQRGVEAFEILVIDGGSTDGTGDIVTRLAAEDPRVRLLPNPHRRIPHALNIGLAHARGEYIARMDAHTSYPDRYLATGIARLQRGDVEWASGPQLPVAAGGRTGDVVAALGTRVGIGGAEFRRADAERVVDSGFTGILRAEVLRGLGGWDEDWEVNEDGEIAARLRAAGGTIVCVPDMAADYVPRATLRALAAQYHRYGMYRCKTAGRHPSALRRTHLVPPAMLLTAAVAVVPSPALRTAARIGLGAYCAAIVAAAVRAPRPRSVTGVSAVLLTMHGSWALGFARGVIRFGMPWRALMRCAGRAQRDPGGERPPGSLQRSA